MGRTPHATIAERDLDVTLVTEKVLSNKETKQLQSAFKAKFGHELGIRNIVGKRQLDHIPVYGKIDLSL
jgi:F0F1-type ATP synthase delta subunit